MSGRDGGRARCVVAVVEVGARGAVRDGDRQCRAPRHVEGLREAGVGGRRRAQGDCLTGAGGVDRVAVLVLHLNRDRAQGGIGGPRHPTPAQWCSSICETVPALIVSCCVSDVRPVAAAVIVGVPAVVSP